MGWLRHLVTVNAKVCLFRADASTAIGTGHVIRCRTLAQAMWDRGWEIHFAARETAGLDASLKGIGSVITIPTGVDTLSEPDWIREQLPGNVTVCVTDSYALSSIWQSSARRWASAVVAVDDLAAARQDVDLLLNQNLGATARQYADLVPAGAGLLLGPRFALVRPEFARARRHLERHTGQVRRALIFMSGSDAPNVTARAAAACVQAGVAADVVIGPANPHLVSIRRWAEDQPLITIHHDVANMADLMVSADIAIGAGGSSSWERCVLGLPAIVVVLAQNQVAICDALARRDCVISLGWQDQVDVAAVYKAINLLRDSPDRVMKMSRAARKVADGLGVGRVATALEALAIRQPGTPTRRGSSAPDDANSSETENSLDSIR